MPHVPIMTFWDECDFMFGTQEAKANDTCVIDVAKQLLNGSDEFYIDGMIHVFATNHLDMIDKTILARVTKKKLVPRISEEDYKKIVLHRLGSELQLKHISASFVDRFIAITCDLDRRATLDALTTANKRRMLMVRKQAAGQHDLCDFNVIGTEAFWDGQLERMKEDFADEILRVNGDVSSSSSSSSSTRSDNAQLGQLVLNRESPEGDGMEASDLPPIRCSDLSLSLFSLSLFASERVFAVFCVCQFALLSSCQ
jgi:hypothetical protein